MSSQMYASNYANSFSTKKFFLNSQQIFKGLSYAKCLSAGEYVVLSQIMQLLPIIRNGHDLSGQVTVSNGALAAAIKRSIDFVSRHKESLHAKGIITVDGKEWSDYRYNDGTRYKSKFVHCVRLHPMFSKAFYSAAIDRHLITTSFEYHHEYIQKTAERRERNALAVLKHRVKIMGDSVNNLLKSCENIPMKSVSQDSAIIPITAAPNSNLKYLNTKNKEVNSTTGFTNILNSIGLGKKEYKTWTESAKSICLALLSSGKTPTEVSATMVKQAYCKNHQHWIALMNYEKMNC